MLCILKGGIVEWWLVDGWESGEGTEGCLALRGPRPISVVMVTNEMTNESEHDTWSLP